MMHEMKRLRLTHTKIYILLTAIVAAIAVLIPVKAFAAGSAPVLTSLNLTKSGRDGYNNASLTFETSFGSEYIIYRKSASPADHNIKSSPDYIPVGRVTSYSGSYTFTDTGLPASADFVYTVRKVEKNLFTGNTLSRCDESGISTLSDEVSIKVAYTNLAAKISWKAVKGATGYNIYKRFEGGRFSLVTSVPASQLSFQDSYYRTFTPKEKSLYLRNGCFFDVSSNCLSYTVRAVRNDMLKQSIGPYEYGGYFNLSEPVIIDLDSEGRSVYLSFDRIPYAEYYKIMIGIKNGSDDKNWQTCIIRPQSSEQYQAQIFSLSETALKYGGNDSNIVDTSSLYFSVRAYAHRGGQLIASRFETDFTALNRSYSDKKILYIGDSITYGTPYSAAIGSGIYSYPWRVSELLEADYYNAAIPGSTLTYSRRQTASIHRYRIISDVVPAFVNGVTPGGPAGLQEPNDDTFSDFDIIVICAGTNDYLDDRPIGHIGYKDNDTYLGAYNILMQDIEEASQTRVANGKKPIIIILPGLYYSNRTIDFVQKNNRFTTENDIGLTLSDYQEAIDQIAEKYNKRSKKNKKGTGLDIIQFDTSRFVTSQNCDYNTFDNLHMTRNTYARIGSALAEVIKKAIDRQ